MKILMSLNIMPHKGKKFLDTPPFTYLGVTLTRSDNTSSYLNIDLIGSDIFGDIDCGDNKYSVPHRGRGGGYDLIQGGL